MDDGGLAAHSHEQDFKETKPGARPNRTVEKQPIVPLRVELKPFERIVIGEAVLINSGTRSSFLTDGAVPIPREQDTVTPETANTPVGWLYLCVQTMYLKNDIPRYRTPYLGFVKELAAA